MPATIASRKRDHVRIVATEDVAAKGVGTGFDAVRLPHNALPELDLNDVDPSTWWLGKRLRAPLLVSSMTGGAPDVARINWTLATAAQRMGVAMGVGSQRAAIGDPASAYTYAVRRAAPDIPLLANIGAVQLNYGYGVDECRRAVEMIGADALFLHLNPLQEALQPEGDTNFKGLLHRIERVCARIDVPVIVKEVGSGISAEVARRLCNAGVSGIDVAGAGGTSWSEVERFRQPDANGARVAAAFAGWGLPTAQLVPEVRRVAPDVTLIASGGVRTGVDVAKAIALGADIVGFAKPMLDAALEPHGVDAAIDLLNAIITELRIALFCTGCATLHALRSLPLHSTR